MKLYSILHFLCIINNYEVPVQDFYNKTFFTETTVLCGWHLLFGCVNDGSLFPNVFSCSSPAAYAVYHGMR
jgi:hypothetical protein